MVPQENILFYDTVWNNICYGLTNVPKERVIAAAQAALAEDFILALPNGYNTVIGERGTRLSGGARPPSAPPPAIPEGSARPFLPDAPSGAPSGFRPYAPQTLTELMGAPTTPGIPP